MKDERANKSFGLGDDCGEDASWAPFSVLGRAGPRRGIMTKELTETSSKGGPRTGVLSQGAPPLITLCPW